MKNDPNNKVKTGHYKKTILHFAQHISNGKGGSNAHYKNKHCKYQDDTDLCDERRKNIGYGIEGNKLGELKVGFAVFFRFFEYGFNDIGSCFHVYVVVGARDGLNTKKIRYQV